jgi:glucose-6-phosphate 1-dehydrogenase
MDVAARQTAVRQEKPRAADPCAFVIFGASGDLTKRLLVPALYNLAAERLLPEHFAVIGVARAETSDAKFREAMGSALREFATSEVEASAADRLIENFSYVCGDFNDDATYRRLCDRLTEVERKSAIGGNCVFYLATPPSVFATVADHLGKSGLSREERGWRRLIVEKPFGTDLASARELNARLRSILSEHQVYRIDHYLGKETVQNIMVLRFANGLFEPLWHRDHIDHVQITVAETVGVGTRGKFYDRTGALRDMVPNHLFQLLSLTAMEPPICFEADAVRTEKSKAIQAIHRMDAKAVLSEVVRGQYTAGRVNGQSVGAYRETQDVAGDSTTETFVAMRLLIDNWRWAGVPFYLRTGKALAARRSEIAVKFKQAPYAMFRDTPVEHLAQNVLVLRIQPDEGASLQFNAKVPGPSIRTDGVRMDFKYKDYFDAAPSTGYETLIYDCMTGDPTLFRRADEIELGWRVVQPILDAWREHPEGLTSYEAGSQGPRAAAELLARYGHEWRPIA